MDIFLVVLRILMLIIGSLAVCLFVVTQAYRQLPEGKTLFRMSDFIYAAIISFLFAVGSDSYWGLLAGLAVFVIRALCVSLFKTKLLTNNGFWMEVKWLKLEPKGFKMPPEMLAEIAKIPGDKHFILPRIVSLWFAKYFMNNMRKKAPKTGSDAQQMQALQMIEGMVVKVTAMQAGKSERLSLPFGVLQVSRR
jgi:hypothetical protein